MVGVVLALTACAAGAAPTEEYAGGPQGVRESALNGEPQAFYLADAGAIAIVLWGSSTCPPVGERMVVEEPAEKGNVVRVDVREQTDGRPCTRDLTPHTSVFVTPASVTTTKALTIRVDGIEIGLENAVGD